MKTILLSVCLLWLSVLQAHTQNGSVAVRVEAPSRIRVQEEATVRVILRNPFRDEEVTLTATAYYMVGEAQVTSTASTTLTIDRSLFVSAEVNLGVLSLVVGSATFDGQPVTPVRNNSNAWTFQRLLLPADGNDHTIQFRTIR